MIVSKLKKQIKIKSKICFKQILHIIISIQLCFSPLYSSAVEGNGTIPRSSQEGQLLDFQDDIKSFLDKLNPNLKKPTAKVSKQIQKITKIGEVLQAGKHKEYLSKQKSTDFFLLSNQRVDFISYVVSYGKKEKTHIVEQIDSTSFLNEYLNIPSKHVFQEVFVRYNSSSKMLFLEGISGGKVILRQSIPGLDIVKYIYDGEFLIILDKKKGLLVIDMIFAKVYLGNSPIPVFKMAVPIFKVLKKIDSDLLDQNKDSLGMAFLNRSAKVDIIPDSVKLETNYQGKKILMAGDVMFSYTDENKETRLVYMLTRKDIKKWVELYHRIINIMVTVVAPSLISTENFAKFENNITKNSEANPEPLVEGIMSALFTPKALDKLSGAIVVGGRNIRIQQLDEEENPPEKRDSFYLEDIKKYYKAMSDVIKESAKKRDTLYKKIIKKFFKSKETKKEDINVTGQVSTTEELAERIKFQNKKSIALRIMANIVSLTPKKAINWMKTNPIISGTLGSAGTVGFLYPAVYVHLANIVSEVLVHLDITTKGISLLNISIANLAFLGVVLPGSIFFLSYLSIPFIKFIKTIIPKHISIRKKVYHPKAPFINFLNKWENSTITQRLVGVGVQFVAYAIYPLWHYIARIIGQPQLISALQKGLNPFKKVKKNSDVGRAANLKKNMLLGVGKPSGSHNSDRENIQNIQEIKNQKIKSMAWLISSLAVAKKEQISPLTLLILGSSADLPEISKVYNDAQLKAEMLWVMEKLIKEIDSLDEVDITKDTPIDTKLIIQYHKKALALAKKVKKHPALVQKIRLFLTKDKIYQLRQKLKLSSIMGFNQVQHDTLLQIPSMYATARVLNNFMVDHILVTLIPLLLTERTVKTLDHESISATAADGFFGSGNSHSTEVVQNTITHLFIAGAGLILTMEELFSKIQNLNEEQKKVYSQYEPHAKKIAKKDQSDAAYFGQNTQAMLSQTPSSFGNILVRSNFRRLRTLQMSIFLMIGMRYMLTSFSIEESLMSGLYFLFAADIFFNWPWFVILGGTAFNTQWIEQNIKKMNEIKTGLSYVGDNKFKTEKELIDNFIKFTTELVSLYKGRKEQKQIQQILNMNLNTNLSSELEKKSASERQQISEQLVNLMANNPPLANQMNKLADLSVVLLFGGIFTNLLFVALSIKSFDIANLSWGDVGIMGAIHVAFLTVMGGLLYNAKVGKQIRKTVSKRITTLSWNNFYKKHFLSLSEAGKKTINSCRGAFSRK